MYSENIQAMSMRDRVTICIKTIHRPHCCATLVRSIHEHCGDDRPLIYVLDDGKPHLDRCRWQRSKPPELPFPDNRQSIELINEWKDDPPTSYDIGSIFRPDLAANLLAVYPKLLVSGTWSDELTVYDERLTNLDETFSSHLVLTRFLIRLGVNARRFKLRIKEGDDATIQLART
jgi:hypothetical protein